MLNGTVKTVREVEVRDLDDTITEFLKSKGIQNKNFDKYGYESIAENEWGNYQQHSFTVEPKALDPEDLADLQLHLPSTSELLNWMCLEGQLAAGEYLVDCSW